MSDDRCREFDILRAGGEPAGEAASRWRDHLAGCADCREQAAADGLLREGLKMTPPQLSPDFEGRLRRRLERRTAKKPVAARRPGTLRPSGLWTLAAYGTAATIVSAVILSRLPWQSFTPSPALLIGLGGLALLSPLVLLDRVGIIRPPG